jgi:chromosome segregation ATPase
MDELLDLIDATLAEARTLQPHASDFRAYVARKPKLEGDLATLQDQVSVNAAEVAAHRHAVQELQRQKERAEEELATIVNDCRRRQSDLAKLDQELRKRRG